MRSFLFLFCRWHFLWLVSFLFCVCFDIVHSVKSLCTGQNGTLIICKNISANQINAVYTLTQKSCLPVHTQEKKEQLLTNWFDVKEGHSSSPQWKDLDCKASNHSTTLPPTTTASNTQLCPQSPLQRGPSMQPFRQQRYVFGFLFHFKRGEIANIFFYSPLAPLESHLSFGLFMKNYFMLTYICRLFSPSVTCRRFSSILKALKPILYVCGSAFSIELRLKYQQRGWKGMARGNQWSFNV